MPIKLLIKTEKTNCLTHLVFDCVKKIGIFFINLLFNQLLNRIVFPPWLYDARLERL